METLMGAGVNETVNPDTLIYSLYSVNIIPSVGQKIFQCHQERDKTNPKPSPPDHQPPLVPKNNKKKCKKTKKEKNENDPTGELWDEGKELDTDVFGARGTLRSLCSNGIWDKGINRPHQPIKGVMVALKNYRNKQDSKAATPGLLRVGSQDSAWVEIVDKEGGVLVSWRPLSVSLSKDKTLTKSPGYRHEISWSLKKEENKFVYGDHLQAKQIREMKKRNEDIHPGTGLLTISGDDVSDFQWIWSGKAGRERDK